MDIINMKQKVSAVIFLILLALPGSGLLSEKLPVTPPTPIRVRGFIGLHERRPQNYFVVNMNLKRPNGMPITNAKVRANGVSAPHYSPGDYSGGSTIGAITPGMPLNLSISVDGREVITGSATLAVVIKCTQPRPDALINRRLTPFILVEWIFSSGSWPVDLKVRKLPEKTDVFVREGIRGNRFEVPVSGFPPASEADIVIHTYYAYMHLVGDLTPDSQVRLGYSTAQYVRTTN